MSNAQRGKLILKEVPVGEVEQKVVMLLSKFSKSASIEALTEKVKNAPYALSNDIDAEKAALIIEAFQKLGATAVFVPLSAAEAAAEKFTPIESAPRFTLGPTSAFEEKPLPIQEPPERNGIRRLITILVIILLILSMGYLTWQLWPMLQDNIRELEVYLKKIF